MMERMRAGQLFPHTHPPGALHRKAQPQTAASAETATFSDVLSSRMLKFSHHAETRLEQRGIRLMPEQLHKIESAIDKAAAKGAKESLMVMEDVALIVNIKNRTVVTAMDGRNMQDNVFTQIDSAVIIS